MLLELFLAALDIEMSIRNTALTLSQRRLAHLVRNLRSFNFLLVSSHRRRMRSLFDTQIILALLQLGGCLGMSINPLAEIGLCLRKTALYLIAMRLGYAAKTPNLTPIAFRFTITPPCPTLPLDHPF